MSTKHTDGPWRVLIEGNHCFIEDANGDTVARVSHPFPFTTTDDERDANARLIAAAPDLLEALEALREKCKADGWLLRGDMAAEMDASSAAIAAATGSTT
jgi:hypothetical protein